ncbi:hypothetical protein HYH02_008548 [Chlamydomonas schloesseri]|uniref:Uncharacterized protein n=1 Tax=Chlamydomonas schloesseri TaxID=2026947 RepID=A0A835WFR1_9CHLO|nr:hypothetical protein HYH02_008548 [Chlamydomonas schloesseri]|eukprot:KAG2446561.1 hypothetical protein HYH02_008548 [Chlamydomonas schloesseri]
MVFTFGRLLRFNAALLVVVVAASVNAIELADKRDRVKSCTKRYREKSEKRVAEDPDLPGGEGGNGKAKYGRLGALLQKDDRDSKLAKLRDPKSNSKARKFDQIDGTCKASKVETKKSKAKNACHGKGKGKKDDAECGFLALGGTTQTTCSDLDCREDCLEASKAEADTSVAVRRMLLEGDDGDEFEDAEEDTEQEDETLDLGADLLADREWERMCVTLDDDVDTNRTDTYVDSLTEATPTARRMRRRQLSAESFTQPNTPQELKDAGVITLDVDCSKNVHGLCRMGQARYPTLADWRHAEVTNMIEAKGFAGWSDKANDPYYQDKKTATEKGSYYTEVLLGMSYVNLALGTAQTIAGTTEVSTGFASPFFAALVQFNPWKMAAGIVKGAFEIATTALAAEAVTTAVHDAGLNSIEITSVHENARVAIYNQHKSLAATKAKTESTANELVKAASDNTQQILDLLTITKQGLLDKEEAESKATRTNLTAEVKQLKDNVKKAIADLKAYYEARISALEDELCASKAQLALLAEDQNQERKVILTPEGRRNMYNSAPKAQPPFAELECVDPLAFWETCSARRPALKDVENLIIKNRPIASCKPI